MNQCPRCKNEELQPKQNYCQICGLDLKEVAVATTTSFFQSLPKTGKYPLSPTNLKRGVSAYQDC